MVFNMSSLIRTNNCEPDNAPEFRHSKDEHLKAAQRAELAADVEAYLAQGGTITPVPVGKIALADGSEWSQWVVRNAKGN